MSIKLDYEKIFEVLFEDFKTNTKEESFDRFLEHVMNTMQMFNEKRRENEKHFHFSDFSKVRFTFKEKYYHNETSVLILEVKYKTDESDKPVKDKYLIEKASMNPAHEIEKVKEKLYEEFLSPIDYSYLRRFLSKLYKRLN